MTTNELVIGVVEALEAERVPYMLVGAYSANVYGVPRSTKDADFVVQLTAEGVKRVVARLGAGYRLEPQMSFETVTGTSRHIIHAIDSAFEIELFCLKDEPYDQERFSRRRQGPLLGKGVFFPSAEDVVVTKLRWSKQGQRGKDLDDLRNILSVQGDNLDWGYIHRWCDEHETRELLNEILGQLRNYDD